MTETKELLVSTSSLATALSISIIVHVICGIYCLLKSRFKRSSLRPNGSELCYHSNFCHVHQNPLTWSMSDTRYLPSKLHNPLENRKSMDNTATCQCSLVDPAGKRFHSPLQQKGSVSNMNAIHNCSWMSAQSLSDANDVDTLEQSCKELSSSCLNENVIYHHTPNIMQTLNAGFPLLASMRELYQVTERSLTRTVCSKLVVSVTHLVTDAGDTLYLDNTGISLYVPAGAVGDRQKQLISLVLNWDLSDSPSLEESQSLVSPVVYCGPHGLKLKKSCVLTYKHCAYNAKHLNVMVSETELSGQKSWQPLELFSNNQSDRKSCSQSEESHGKSITITQDECQVNISSFTLYTAIMSIPNEKNGGHLRCGKWLQVAVFSYSLHADSVHHQTRLYFLNKTPCALQWAIQNESKFGGSMCCPEKVFLFSGSQLETGKDMLIRTTYISENWELIDDADNSNKVPFLYIWHGKCPYASLCFRRKATTDQDYLQELNIQFFIYQENMEHAGEKLDLQTLSLSKPSRSSENSNEDRVCMKHRVSQININVSLNKGTDQLALYSAANQLKCQRIPQELRLKLRLLLDPPCTFGNNWKFLASEMGLDSSIPYLSTAESPTEELMGILEQKMSSLDDLQIYLQDIDRLDAMKEVQDFIAKTAENK